MTGATVRRLILEASTADAAERFIETQFRSQPIERCAWGDERVEQLMSAGEPVIITGSPLAEPAVGSRHPNRLFGRHDLNLLQESGIENG